MVAAVGVATVSFTGSQGCDPHPPEYITTTSGNLVAVPAYEAGIDLVTVPDAAAPLPSTDNLSPPQGVDASAGPNNAGAKDAAQAGAHDAGLPTSGNLLPPPRDARLKDAGRIVIPPTGNLMPAPPTSQPNKP